RSTTTEVVARDRSEARGNWLTDFSVQPLCSLCLCGCCFLTFINHRDTENTEVAQRIRRKLMRWKSRLTAFTICFAIGLTAAFIIAAFLRQRHRQRQPQTQLARCQPNDYFNRPEEVLTALKSDEVNVRREMFKRLLL